MPSRSCFWISFILFTYFEALNGRVYTIEIHIVTSGGAANTFMGRLENTAGTLSEVFPLDDTYCSGGAPDCLKDSGTFTYQVDVTDIGDIKYFYIMTRESNNDGLYIDDVIVNDGTAKQADDLGTTTIEYTGSHPDGCEVGVYNVVDDDVTSHDEEPCVTFPKTTAPSATPSGSPTTATPTTNTPTILPTSPTTGIPTSVPVTSDPTTSIPTRFPTTMAPTGAPTPRKCYSITIGVRTQGGSEDDIWIIIVGQYSVTTEAYNLGQMKTGGNNFQFDNICLQDVGTIIGAYLVTYGKDALWVDRVEVDGLYATSAFGKYLEFSDADTDPTGCAVLMANFNTDDLNEIDQTPCTTIPYITPSPVTPSPTNVNDISYNIKITLLPGGGSKTDIYIIIEGDSNTTASHLLYPPRMDDGGETYNFEIFDIDVGTITYAYLVSYAEDALTVTDIIINSIYSVSETFGDLLEYEDSNPNGCAVLTADFGGSSMTVTEEIPCVRLPPSVIQNVTDIPLSTSVGEIIYNVVIELFEEGGSDNDIWIVIEGETGIFTSPYNLGQLLNGGDAYYYSFVDIDVGNIVKTYLINYNDNDLIVTDITVNDNKVDETFGDYLEYDGSSPYGCGVLTVNFIENSMNVDDQEPCSIIPANIFTANVSNITFSIPWRVYTVSIEIFYQGGSKHDIFAGIEGVYGDMSEFVNIGVMDDIDNIFGEVFTFNLNLTNVGIGAKLYLINYGSDSLLVEGCDINGNNYEESTYDILEYNDIDHRGCNVLICDVLTGTGMSTNDEIPCPNYAIPYPSNKTTTYRIDIDIANTFDALDGGSENEIYVVIQGITGIISEVFSVGVMTEEDRIYRHYIETLDIGEPKALYLVTYGDDALAVAGIVVQYNSVSYEVSESTWDYLEYEDNAIEGCGVLKADFLNDDMSTYEQIPCDIIPFFFSISNGTYQQYLIALDTTLLPTGGTDDKIWMQIINTDNQKSEYILLQDPLQPTDNGELYQYRPNITNLGQTISKIQFIHFSDDDFCIDYCQINQQVIDLSFYDYECSENNMDDNDGCSVITCDFELNQIVSDIQSPCLQDVYGWNNKSYRVYDVIIDICNDADGFIDTISNDPFYILFENDVFGYSDYYHVDSLGFDGENNFQINTTNIGVPDKLYLLHYNNDDVCISWISVDGFSENEFPWTSSEYDCEYSDEGCNVITVDFEENEIFVDTQGVCEYEPPGFNAEEDSCWFDYIPDLDVQSWIDQLFDFVTTVGIITGIALIVIILCCIIGCCWCGFIILKKRNSDDNIFDGTEMTTQ